MAKSLRSKSRRKNVRAQREKYNARVIEQLKKTLGLTKEYEKIRKAEIMKDVSEINLAIAEFEKKNKAAQKPDVEMEDDSAKTSDADKGSDAEVKLSDGQHPVWKSQRKIKAAKKAKKAKAKKGKKTKKVGKKAGKAKN